ncbi:MAG TPA: Hsp20/alpha crystallin family protein [Solirubrobacterales bacterium]|jgi:HSP20 family protein|nr:Hsp20/alpha crystallin family protein [Solirubrobacterales bacterium]
MALVRWDPARELDAFQGDMNRLFDGFFGRRDAGGSGYGSRRWVPAMDLVETDDSLILRADLPGVRREDVSIEVKDGVLTVAGERRVDHEEKREGYHRVERSFGRFLRSLELPKGVEAESVNASMEEGVLEVRIPKPAESKATRIEVGGEKRTIEHQPAEERELAAAGSDSES